MMIIKKLYTEPALIEPIVFTSGINVILGEKSDISDKRNSVGKSLSIEFINFAFLKKAKDSRVSLIPKEVFPPETQICLDFEIHGNEYTVKRSMSDSEQPVIFENGTSTKFTKIEDATKFLTEKLFSNSEDEAPSFRIMLGPLIRDERSEFKSLINCYDTSLRIAENYSPHLYLLGIDVEIYEFIKRNIQTIDDISSDLNKIKENVKLLRQKDIEDSRSDLNELDGEVRSIEESIDNLENMAGYEIVRGDIIQLEEKISDLRRKKTLLQQTLLKLKPIERPAHIDVTEISEFYENIKSGMGSLIKKELNEVLQFKAKIEEFQNELLNERKKSFLGELSNIDGEILLLDKQYSNSLSVLDQQGNLKNLKQTYAAFKEKSDQLSQLRSFIGRFDQLEIEKQKVKSEKEAHLLKLQSLIQGQKDVIDSFEKTILVIHEFIQGNKHASFKIKHTTKKQVIEINMRIDTDRGHSVERAKVFIYDLSLLLNESTAKRHPGFLIHDNIFDVDKDTLMRSLKFLIEEAHFNGRQYICTLNSDTLEGENTLDVSAFVKAEFTKATPFLKRKYQETH